MRDFILFGIMFGLLPFCFLRPWIGVLVFSWISYMNPHRFTWGAAYDFPFAKIAAVATILGLLFTRDRMPLPKTRETVLIILLGIYFTFTNFFAFYPEAAWIQWEKVIKILIMTLVTMTLINDQRKLKYFIMIIAFSIGFLGIKGGIFSLVTGGEHMVLGPRGSFFYDNNDMALALNMLLPMLFYLAKDENNKQLRTLFWFTFVMSIISVIFTYSRGGFVTFACIGTILFLKSRYKILAAIIVSIALIAGMSYIPEGWVGRMETIKTYEESQSAMGRIYAWHTAWNVAKDRPFVGSGFEGLRGSTRYRYSPQPDSTAGDVHSVYFEVLGEHGFVAFGLFIALMSYTLLTAQGLKKIARTSSRKEWAENYANMFQVSLLAYIVGGLFLGRAYFDLFYHIVAMVAVMKILVLSESKQSEAARNSHKLTIKK